MPQFRVNARDSAESGTRIYDKEDRQGLCPYIVLAPLSMQKIYWDKDQDIVSWKSSASGYFQGKEMHFSCPRPAAVYRANGERRADGKPGRTTLPSAVAPWSAGMDGVPIRLPTPLR
ncbi:MAG: hypothetical protein IMZ50_05880 [Candidatus Atribacteria bacterium]|nr:hypothetical protein [Candidatus Atribacteria bacterium]